MTHTQSPQVVEYAARRLLQTAFFILMCDGIFLALLTEKLFRLGFSLSYLDSDYAFAFFLLLGVGAFHIILALQFRKMKRWTYRIADFMIRWGRIAYAKNTIKGLHEAEIRKSFGLKPHKSH